MPSISIVAVVCILVGIIALVDATRRPQLEWTLARQSKAFWLLLMSLGLVLWGLGIVAWLVYFVRIRRQLDAAARASLGAIVTQDPRSAERQALSH